MRRTFFILMIILIINSFGGCCYSENNTPLNDNTSLKWIPNDSYFVDYKIVGEKIVFRYSIAFQNNSDSDISFNIGVRFSEKDTKEWLKNEILSGKSNCKKDENGYIILRKNERKSIIFIFEGVYLGGKVNNNLSFPEEIIPTIIFKE